MKFRRPPAPTRRDVLCSLALPAASFFPAAGHAGEVGARAQGMASRDVHSAPRGKPSGVPFHARFTDVADQAGLKQITVAGHAGRAGYIVEVMTGGVAFFDFDNDGWLDVLVLCGSRFGDPPPGASNRLYKNNRDGTFVDVTEKAGLLYSGYANWVTVGDYNNDGF